MDGNVVFRVDREVFHFRLFSRARALPATTTFITLKRP
jgi:hypothetical protein